MKRPYLKSDSLEMLNEMRFLNKGYPSDLPTLLISDHAQQNRVMPPGTPRPGPLDLNYTPYLIEPMNNMSPMSHIQHQAIMKGAQGGFTMLMECVTCYYMQYCPTDQLFVSSTDSNLERWAARRLEYAINSYGLRKYIYSQTTNKKSRKSGDKTFSKEYFGCRLDMVSAQSPSGLRSMDKQVLQRDEIDGAPALLTTGEGSWLEVSLARTNFFGDRRKVNDVSTPTTFENSEIYREYLSGDQRKFLVECPLCGKAQELKFGNDKSQYGLKPEKKVGILLDAYYICEFCHDAFFNYQKGKLLSSGVWTPEAISSSPFFRSYHWSSLLAPPGALSWVDVYRAYEKSLDTPDGMRSFVNLYLGLPFKESGSRPKIEKVIELRGGYRSGQVPNDVLYLTMGLDVQSGSKTDPNNPARIEFEVLGVGAGYRTWSILYKRIEGAIDIPEAGAWKELNDFALSGGLTFRRDDGYLFKVALCFMDSGDGNFMDIVYRFTETWQNTFPSKGVSALKKKKPEVGDEAGPSNFLKYRAKKVNEDMILYEISTNYYKTHIYNNLKIERNPLDPQRPGFCDFPVDYSERYFQMLVAEEKRRDGSFNCPSGRRNEALDCRVYALCAADVWLDARVQDFKLAAKQAGATPIDLQQINHRFVIESLINQTKRKSL